MGDILGGQLSTNENGRTTLTGAGSDINFGKQIDKIIEAKRQPAVRLENRIQENQTKVDALNQLQQRLKTLQDAANALRGRVAVDNQGNVFENKSGFLSASRTDTTEPSQANSILTANVDNDAQVGTNTLEVLQTAERQRVTSDQISNPGSDLGESGTFKINGRDVTVQANDSLADIADGINTAFADAGEAESVNASITNVASNNAVLSIQGPEGKDMTFADSSGTVLQSLGVLNAGGEVKNETQAAQVAKFKANGLSDGSVGQSSLSGVTDPNAALGLSSNGDLTFTVPNGVTNVTRSVEVDGSDSLNSIADKVNQKQGVSAEVVENSAGEFAIDFSAGTQVNAQQTGFFQAGAQLSDLGIDDSVDLTLTDTAPGGSVTTQTLTLDPSDTLADVESTINSGSAATARVITNSDGQESLVIESASQGRLDVKDDENGNAVDSLQLDRDLRRGDVPADEASLVVSGAVDPSKTLDTVLGTTNNQEFNIEVTKADGSTVGPSEVNINNISTKTIRDARDAINNQAGGVAASIVKDGGQERLAIRPDDPGATVEITAGAGPKSAFFDQQLNPNGGPAAPDASVRSDYDVPGLLVGTDNVDGPTTASTNDNTVVGDGSLATGDGLEVRQQDVLTRQTNKIEDLFEGTTINLLKAEPGTEVKLDIERNLGAVKESINNFVEAFNGVKRFINAQRQERAIGEQDPSADDSIVGALNGETILNRVEQDINRVVSTGAENVNTDFSVLRQIGIQFVNNDNLSDPTNEDTLKIESKELDDKLLNDFNDVRNLFEFDFRSPNSGLSLIGTSDETGAANGTLNVEVDGNGNVVDGGTLNLDIDGGASGLAVEEVSDNVLKVQEGPLEGLTLNADLSGPAGTKNIDISTSTGVGFNGFNTAKGLAEDDPREGVVESKIAELVGSDSPDIEGQNERFRDEIERIERGLERERERLLQQFTTAEEALIELESAQQRLTQFAGGGSSDN